MPDASLKANIFAAATSKSGSKTKTYYSASNTAIFSVTVTGGFSYTYGVSASATSSVATVYIFDSSATFVSKNAYTSGATAYATGTVKYRGNSATLTVSLTCDKYGNLS